VVTASLVLTAKVSTALPFDSLLPDDVSSKMGFSQEAKIAATMTQHTERMIVVFILFWVLVVNDERRCNRLTTDEAAALFILHSSLT
jgi:hypothetical protein